MSVKAKLAVVFLACLLPLAAACVETAMLYRGATVSSVPVVAQQEGTPVAGRWETFEMAIDYTYQRDGDNLELSGQAALGQHYQMNYTGVLRMQTYLFFLDRDARVLETFSIVTPWSGIEDAQKFSKSYPMPAGTTAISFGYSGSVNSMDSTSSFYKLPLSRQ